MNTQRIILLFGACSLGCILMGLLVLSRFHQVSTSAAWKPSPAQSRPARGLARAEVKRAGAPAYGHRALLATLQALEAEADPMLREEEMAKLVESLAIAEVPAAVEMLGGRFGSGLGWDLTQRLLRRWAEADPTAAANWVSGLAEGPARLQAINTVALGWARKDLSAAASWAQQLSGDERASAILNLAYQAAKSDPLESLKLASELPANEHRDDLVAHATSQWAAESPEEAIAWAKQLTDTSLREQVLAAASTAWAETNSVAAATFVTQEMAAGRLQENTVMNIVQRWAQKDPQPASSWVNQFPAGSFRDTAVENLVRLWAAQDPVQAGNYVNGLDAGTGRDMAVSAYAAAVAPVSPESAVKWAENISDETLRLAQLEVVGQVWMASDEAGARAWLASSTLPVSVKGRLLAQGSR